ncbi:G protein-regulated inducer of neurite outgrowth 1-like [Carassius auratus]|uniref:G protein-regulated inducer of neurite outgrowth 1-like n=1 Tax=Carassius auratus TaxID=7957 RepID=A0A6P6QS09_CARAU|nr:G protein-regulated inducer of neurite outgrowth 1-like [Carassius auratus]XP_026136186.1 G protein-regulated inducer of neurite outgrowth 1-like [Carassius auratus]XP_026136187.1 G protein-regulated inducer of neurite outgrowth 1-like [Carassius auratus]
MEGPVLTESEVWKVGSGTTTSINTNDYSALMNDNVTDENPGTAGHKEICGSIEEQPDQEISSDQIKSVIPHEQRLEEELSSTQTAVKSDEPPAAAFQPEWSVNQADKMCLASGQQSLDQEITILVTNHDCTLEDEENVENEENEDEFGEQKTSSCPAEPEMVSSVKSEGVTEEESLDGSIVVANVIEVSQVQKTSVISHVSPEQNTTNEGPRLPGDPGYSSNETKCGSKCSSTPQKTNASSTGTEVNICSLKDQPTKPEDVEVKLKKTESTKCKDPGRPSQETLTLTQSHGRTQTVQTQVSLEVMYQSVATSPMTPQEGSAAFLFPGPFGKLANKCSTDVALTKDAEMQVGPQVEFRSVATAPMTPIILNAPEVFPEPEPRIGVTTDEVPEPVQEVSWDEKGMTWEVYGAVVEVAVLGSAIQKHLEKQVKKQKQPLALPCPADGLPANPTETSMSMPSSPPPISDLGESSLAKEQSEEKTVQSGRRRQNNFRQWFRNIWRPKCCTRPRQDEEN